MKKPQDVTIKDLCHTCGEQLVQLDIETLPELPHPYEDWDEKQLPEYPNQADNKVVTNLDGTSVLKIKEPETEEEKQEMVEKFLKGVDRLFTAEDNWTFLQPFLLSIDNCIKCNTCADACPVFEESGRAEIYRPLFRAETLRRIAKQKKTGLGKLVDKMTGSDLEITWESVARLAELSYRCTLCRRCAQACPMGVDNGLITRELRKLFSQEMGIHPTELHEDGTIKHLTVGSSTGMNPMAFKDIIEFVEEDIEDKTGMKIEIPMDKEGADILVMHNAGEFLSWPENLMAFAILFDVAGLDWTLSSELLGYDSVNYGLFYDDVQYARVTLKHANVAKELGVKKVVMGECGHAHKAFMAIGDRLWLDENNIHRESALTLMEDLVLNGNLEFDISRNNFPVTLHDPCNVTRSMGIVQPQRRILNKICPGFREMYPFGVNNYCCGGGSGFAIMQSGNFPHWRKVISGRRKMAQILNAFQPEIDDKETKKYVCAPCSNCKGQIRDLIVHYDAWERCGVHYGGLVELIVNALTAVPEGFLEWEDIM